MTDSNDLPRRIAELEANLTHQELSLQELSGNAARQWDMINKLEQTVQRLEQRCQALEEAGGSATTSEEPPPHY